MLRCSRREGLGLMLGAVHVAVLGRASAGRSASSGFRFVTTSNPHGVLTTTSTARSARTSLAQRPAYSATDPRSASIIDPMSGIEMFRVGGDNGSPLYINGNQDSGLKFPRILRQENLGTIQKTWNADSTLLMIDRYFARSGDPSHPAKSYIVDVTGAYTGTPWRIIRAAGSPALGDGHGMYWVWDPANPLRAYVFSDDGSIDEWWPVGGSGEPVGKVNRLFGPVPDYSHWATAGRSRLHTSHNGQFVMTGCRRNSDGRWGGRRRDLLSGELGPFVPTPDEFNDSSDRAANGISANGLYTKFSPNGNRHRFYDTETGALVSDTKTFDETGLTHADFVEVNGRQYLAGCRTDTIRMWDVAAARMQEKANIPGTNPNHVTCRNYLDRFETHGAAGGATSGVRYMIYARSNPRDGHPRAIIGVRLGPQDSNVLRYLANHRGVRRNNSDECHPAVSPNGRFIAFNSNWQEPGVELSNEVHPYVLLLPEAWHSSSNDGS